MHWTKDMDTILQAAVLRNYFNFDLVSVELTQQSSSDDFGAQHAISNDKCRARWTHLHQLRKKGQQVECSEPVPEPPIKSSVKQVALNNFSDKKNSSPNTTSQQK